MKFLSILLPSREMLSILKNDTLAIQFKKVSYTSSLYKLWQKVKKVTFFFKSLCHQNSLALEKHFWKPTLDNQYSIFYQKERQNGTLLSVNLVPKSFPLGTIDCVIKLKLKTESSRTPPPPPRPHQAGYELCTNVRNQERSGSSSLLANIQPVLLAHGYFTTPELWEQITIWVLWRERWILSCAIHWGN